MNEELRQELIEFLEEIKAIKDLSLKIKFKAEFLIDEINSSGQDEVQAIRQNEDEKEVCSCTPRNDDSVIHFCCECKKPIVDK